MTHRTFTTRQTTGNNHPSAFTLIELMISIALVLILMLGVNQVFKYTTQAVGSGEAINAAIRSSRAAEAAFSSDFAAMIPNGGSTNDAPFMYINSSAVPAFQNVTDKLSDGDGNPLTTDLNNNGTEGETSVPGEVISPATYNYRNHREDILGFMARDVFARQTGNDGTFVDSYNTSEAFIWYGHLWLPDNTLTSTGQANFPAYAAGKGSDTYPGQGGSNVTAPNSALNPNNFYANQFVLGRVAMLLKAPVAGYIYDNQSQSQVYVSPATFDYWSSPLFNTAQYSTSSTPSYTYPYESRYDLAGQSISQMQTSLTKRLAAYSAANGGYQDPTWWTTLLGVSADANTRPYRFRCNPIVAKPMTSAAMAQASPYFLQGCGQFIVEFAGDFLTQDNDPTHTSSGTSGSPHNRYGDITAYQSDGQLDFYVDSNYVKHTIWYGMPRKTSTYDPTILGSNNTKITYNNGDVVPIRDWLRTAVTVSTTANPTPVANSLGPAPFEKIVPAYEADYANNASFTTTNAQSGYQCVWGPNDPHPKLIRITITLEDPTGRLTNGQTYQYVFSVPPNSSGQ